MTPTRIGRASPNRLINASIPPSRVVKEKAAGQKSPSAGRSPTTRPGAVAVKKTRNRIPARQKDLSIGKQQRQTSHRSASSIITLSKDKTHSVQTSAAKQSPCDSTARTFQAGSKMSCARYVPQSSRVINADAILTSTVVQVRSILYEMDDTCQASVSSWVCPLTDLCEYYMDKFA